MKEVQTQHKIKPALKLGVMLGLAWGVIFTGCLINTRGDALGSALITLAIFAAVLFMVFTTKDWIPYVATAEQVEKLGGEKTEENDD